MNSITTYIKRARELESRATSGPWNASAINHVWHSYGYGGELCEVKSPGQNKDAVFIAESRQLVPRLADALEVAVGGLMKFSCQCVCMEYKCDKCEALFVIERILKGEK
jgi:hypothetical protein